MKNTITQNTVRLCLITLAVFLVSFASAQNWYTYSSPAMKYKISFPQQPQEQKQTTQTAAGPVDLDIVLLDLSQNPSASNMVYAVNYTLFPDSLNSDRKDKMDAFFEGSVNGMATNMNGKVSSKKAITYKGFPGTEAKIDLQGQATVTARLILIHNRFYMQMVVSAANKDSNADVTKFLESFESE